MEARRHETTLYQMSRVEADLTERLSIIDVQSGLFKDSAYSSELFWSRRTAGCRNAWQKNIPLYCLNVKR